MTEHFIEFTISFIKFIGTTLSKRQTEPYASVCLLSNVYKNSLTTGKNNQNALLLVYFPAFMFLSNYLNTISAITCAPT